jgi:hypothetical protein
MNKRTLLVCFIVAAILSLIVSTFSVFVAARAYLATNAAKTPSVTEETEDVTSTTAPTETERTPDTDVSEDVGEDVLVGVGAEKKPKYTLKYENGSLLVLADDGTVLYSRKAPSGKPCESELGALSEGIAFSDYSSAISAIYDLVS